MDPKMSTKSKLVLQSVVVLYMLTVTLLFKLNLINPANFITILILCFVEIIMWYILWLNEKRWSGITDELVVTILSKVNKIGMNFLIISIAIFSILLTAPLYTRYKKEFIISKDTIGICLILIIFIFTVIRLLSFIHYDRKGICK
ncbi:hypothetical protein [Clostridium sp.]|jgi:hypothetical protein|uniref:hypothetical protein n=1 Tax=Clostridium sp. TaxID=1506 RepID=UPI003EEB5C1A